MCGIVGYVGRNKALSTLIDGLERLEYRGYDSAGVAFIKDDKLNIIKSEGRISNLKDKIDFNINSNLGIGHTRWATHGIPSKENSHPHKVGDITVVHNGIMENYMDIKKELIEGGYNFNSQTDTEVACALLDKYYKETNDIKEAIKLFMNKVRGSYAFGIIVENDMDSLYCVKKESPLIIGVGDSENYIASDVPAILKYTNKYITLNDFEFAKITKDNIEVYNKDEIVLKDIKEYKGDLSSIDKNGYEHYMLKEIHEQPGVVKNTLDCYIKNGVIDITKSMPNLNKYNKIVIVACGSAMHAGLVSKNLIEEYADIPVDVEIASEFRYKKVFIDENTLVIAVSQSGETADTLAAVKKAKEYGADILGIINVKESTIARESDNVIYTMAGSEIAVATTKAYSAQVALLSLIAYKLSENKNNLVSMREFLDDIKKLPFEMEKLLSREEEYKQISDIISSRDDIFFIGRKIDYALSMEGSLKLKEISYIHSEAYPAGELKHGTISLINDGTPVIGIITDKSISEKTISNIKEVKSRGANIIAITTDDIDLGEDIYDIKITIPKINAFLEPILAIIPLQMISYYVAKNRGCSIDKPKNLAKSVTVE